MPKCSMVGCPIEAVSTVLLPAGRGPVCFYHERELVDRYGAGDVLPRPIRETGMTAREAVLALRGES